MRPTQQDRRQTKILRKMGGVFISSCLSTYCKAFALVTIREIAQGRRLDYAYHIKLRKGKSYEDFMSDLKSIEDLQGLSLMMQESTVDI